MSNSAHWIDVTQADATYVAEPLRRADAYDEAMATANSRRIRAILEKAPQECTLYFPAGVYHFNGAAPGQTATIETTNDLQTFAGDGINATILLQKSPQAEATIRVKHARCIVRELFVGASDRGTQANAEWDANRLQTAIHLDAPPDRWLTDPQILGVNINSRGNNIVFEYFHRPFDTAIKITGPWLDVYVHTAWLRDVKTGIYINQGSRIAGPAKFIDVNFVTTPPDKSKVWTTFFKSETHLMEQVELIHCTFIGAQFIYMDSAARETNGPSTPVYDMVIDHNYINTVWLEAGPDPTQSGVYMNLAPQSNGAYSRDIRFTNNSVTGRAPVGGAFFYVTGMLRGLTFSDNDCSSGLADKCVYARATQAAKLGGTAIRDIKITDNYFRNYKTPITIGGDAHDPTRQSLPANDPGKGLHDDAYIHERVIISGNQTMQEVDTPHGYTTCFVCRAKKVAITGNTFVDNPRSVIVAQSCEEIAVTGNAVGGQSQEKEATGIALRDCRTASVHGNTITNIEVGIRCNSTTDVSLNGNVIRDAGTGILLQNVRGGAVTGNQVSGGKTPLALETLQSVAVTGNRFAGTSPSVVRGKNSELLIRSNLGLPDN